MEKLIFEKGNLGDLYESRPPFADLISYIRIPIDNNGNKTIYNQFFNKSLLSFPIYYLSKEKLESSSSQDEDINMRLPNSFNTQSSEVQNIVLTSNYALMTLFLYVAYWTYGSIDLESKQLTYESNSNNKIAVGNSIINDLWWKSNQTTYISQVRNKIERKLNINNIPPYSQTNLGYVEGNNITGRYAFYWSSDSILLNDYKLGTFFKPLINKADYYRQGVETDLTFATGHPFTLDDKESLRKKLSEQRSNLDKISTWETTRIFNSGDQNIGHYSTGYRLLQTANHFNQLIENLKNLWETEVFNERKLPPTGWSINNHNAIGEDSYWDEYKKRLDALKITIKDNTIARLESKEIYSILKSGIDILYLMVEQSSREEDKIVLRMPQIFNENPTSTTNLVFHNVGYAPSSISPVLLINIDNEFITTEPINKLNIKLYNECGINELKEILVRRIGSPGTQVKTSFPAKTWFLPYVPVLGVYHTITTENSEETVIDIYDSSLPDTTITSTTQGSET